MRVKMTRRVAFSSGHRYWKPDLSADQNRELYGPWASPYNHGHNYVLEVTVDGLVDPETGMLVNIKRVDDLLRDRVVSRFDGKSINDEISEFRDCTPCVENLLNHWRVSLLEGSKNGLVSVPTTESGEDRHPVRLVSLKLEETPHFYGELNAVENIMTLTRSYEFAAAHRLNAPSLSRQQNLDLFGKCNNPAGHGHNYVLEVTVSGTPNPETGMIVDLDKLDAAVSAHVLDRYDHKNLDVDVPELQGKMTTSELVAAAIFQQLEGKLPAQLERIKLFETARNAFEVSR